jgi:hypothetical protein
MRAVLAGLGDHHRTARVWGAQRAAFDARHGRRPGGHNRPGPPDSSFVRLALAVPPAYGANRVWKDELAVISRYGATVHAASTGMTMVLLDLLRPAELSL